MPVIPTKSNRKAQFTVEHAIYKPRNCIERICNKPKNARRITMNFDKIADSFLGVVRVASIRILLRFVNHLAQSAK